MKEKRYIPPYIERLTDHLAFLGCTDGISPDGDSTCGVGFSPGTPGGSNCCDGSSATSCSQGGAPG